MPRQARAAKGAATLLSPDDSLAALKSGNERYVSNQELCSIDLAQSGARSPRARRPGRRSSAAADSRVPPELVFGGQGVGDLFVARNAGNLVDTATLGTVEYDAVVLESPLLVVLAHTSFGAVKAACDVVTDNATYPGAIGPMIELILPATLAVQKDLGNFVNNGALEDAKRTAGRLTAASILIGGLAGDGKLKIVSAINDLKTDVVSFS